LLRDGADEARRIGGIAERGAYLGDAVVQALAKVDVGVVTPDCLAQFLAGDDSAGVFQ
jgi:hypothetical protein